MRSKLQVLESKPTGIPYAQVPAQAMWDLVEYLSWHRVLASYDYATTHFTVTFPHLDLASARELLEQWDTAHDRPEPFSTHLDGEDSTTSRPMAMAH